MSMKIEKPQTKTIKRPEALRAQFELLQAIRNFFLKQNFQDVLTPPAVKNPGMETHIHAYKLASLIGRQQDPYYLHTSPEFHMKELLSLGFEKLFTLGYCFRDEPNSPIHRFQFIMLEWYRSGERYEAIMNDCEKLLPFCLEHLEAKKIETLPELKNLKTERVTIQELFREYLNFDILDFLDSNDLKEKILKDFPDVPVPTNEKLEWDDYYFLLFLNKIETELVHHPSLLLYEFPKHLSALSTLKESDPRVCERFEIYLRGVELCNCFNELRDIKIQRERFAEQAELKKKLYGYGLPEPKVLYDALELGFPESSGVALGVERLLTGLTGIQNPFWI